MLNDGSKALGAGEKASPAGWWEAQAGTISCGLHAYSLPLDLSNWNWKLVSSQFFSSKCGEACAMTRMTT